MPETSFHTTYSDNQHLLARTEKGSQSSLQRHGCHRFGFNGQEMDNEITGQTGTHTTAEFWEYDSRLGRRWNVDPEPKFSESPYAAFANNPICFIDPNGRDTIVDPNGNKQNVGDGYTTSQDGKVLYGDGLKTKVWDPKALGRNGEYNGNYVDYDSNKHGKIKNANSAKTTLKNAMNNIDRTIVQGDLLDDLKTDPAFEDFESEVVMQATADLRFGNTAFVFEKKSTNPITFGGETNTYLPMSIQGFIALTCPLGSMILFPKTWNASLHGTTWVVRNTYVKARVEISAMGAMSVTYSFEDVLDLKEGEDKTGTYNFVVRQLGNFWTGNQEMKVNGAWQKYYIKK